MRPVDLGDSGPIGLIKTILQETSFCSISVKHKSQVMRAKSREIFQINLHLKNIQAVVGRSLFVRSNYFG